MEKEIKEIGEIKMINFIDIKYGHNKTFGWNLEMDDYAVYEAFQHFTSFYPAEKKTIHGKEYFLIPLPVVAKLLPIVKLSEKSYLKTLKRLKKHNLIGFTVYDKIDVYIYFDVNYEKFFGY
jgi:hypothetical protein